MMSLLQRSYPGISTMTEAGAQGTTLLSGHDKASKKAALQAVEVLKKYKSNVHEFTDEIIGFWPLPKKVMERYHFDGVNELNEWLEDQL